METTDIFNQNNDYFMASKTGKVVVFSFKGNLFLTSTIFEAREAVLDFFDQVSNTDAVRVVVLLNLSNRSLREDYLEFYNMIFSSKLRENAILRMYRTFDQIILRIVESDKFFISTVSGKIIPQLFNVSLACDYRVVAKNTVLENIPLELGLVPKGGGAYFLGSLLGLSKTKEFLLSDKKITADEALNLGLVNQVVDLENLKDAALAAAEHYAQIAVTSLSGIKRLVNYSTKDLKQYLEFENEQLLKIIGLAHLTL